MSDSTVNIKINTIIPKPISIGEAGTELYWPPKLSDKVDQIHEPALKHCEYCKGSTPNGIYGECLACGAPREERLIQRREQIQQRVESGFITINEAKKLDGLGVIESCDGTTVIQGSSLWR